MTVIECSREYILNYPNREAYYKTPDMKKLAPIKDIDNLPTNAVLYVKALVQEDDAKTYAEQLHIKEEASEMMDKIKANFAMDCDAYNSISNQTDTYDVQFTHAHFFVKETSSYELLDANRLDEFSKGKLLDVKPLSFTLTPTWKDTVSDILSEDYGDKSAIDVLKDICNIWGASPSTVETLSKKLRKNVASNIKVFETVLNCTHSEALDFAVKYDLGMHYDNINKLASLCEVDFEDLVSTVRRSVCKTTSQSVAVKVSD